MPKSNHSMALPSEAAFTARLTARSSVTVMSDRRSLGYRRRWAARKSRGWRRTAENSGSGPLPLGDVAAFLSGTYRSKRNVSALFTACPAERRRRRGNGVTSAGHGPARGSHLPRAGTGCPVSGVQHDLRVAVHPLVELVIGVGRLVQSELVGDDEAGLRPALDDHVAQVPVVALHVALTRADPQALLEQLADRDEEHALLGLLVGGSRVRRDVQTRHSERAGGPHRADQRVQHDGGLLLAGAAGGRLVADRIDALVGADAVGPVLDLLHGVALGEVDRRGADLLGLLQPL